MQIVEDLLGNRRAFLLNLTAEKAREAQQETLADNIFYTRNSTRVWVEFLALLNLCAEMGLIGELKTLLNMNTGGDYGF